MPSGRTNNFPWKWAWHRSRDPTIFGIWSNISLKLLELETSNLVGGFILGMPSRRTNNFPESGRGLGKVTHTIFGSTVGYPSDSLASCSTSTRQRSNLSTPLSQYVAWRHYVIINLTVVCILVQRPSVNAGRPLGWVVQALTTCARQFWICWRRFIGDLGKS